MKQWLNRHPWVMLVTGVLGISASAIIVRYSSAPSAVTAFYRLAFTVLLMSPGIWGSGETRRALLSADRRTWLLSALSGVLLAVHFAAWFESLQHTSVASSTVIVCTEVIWVALGYRLFMGGRVGKRAAAAIAVSLAGSVLIALNDSAEGAGLYGDLLSLLAAVAVGGYTLLGKKVRESASTGVYTYIVYVFCALCLLLLCAVQGLPLFGYGTGSLFAGFALALFCTVMGHSVFSWCLGYFSPALVSAVKLTEPVAAGALAAVLFGEIPGAAALAGCALVLAGVVYYTVIESRKAENDGK